LEQLALKGLKHFQWVTFPHYCDQLHSIRYIIGVRHVELSLLVGGFCCINVHAVCCCASRPSSVCLLGGNKKRRL